MKIYSVLVMLMVLFIPSLGCAADGSDGIKILFSADFNDRSDWKVMDFHFPGNKNAKIVEKNFLGKSPVLRMALHRFYDEVSDRSEIRPWKLPDPYFEEGSKAVIGREYWYSFRIYFPDDWEFDKSKEIITQWHGNPDFELGENWRNPPVSIAIGKGRAGHGKNYLLVIRADSKASTPDKYQKNRYTFEKKYDLGPLAPDFGKWTQWVFHIKWSYEDDGFMTVWKDEENILDVDRLSNCFNDRLGPFWKLGIYKWDWNDPDFESDIIERVLYYDDIRIGSEKATYEDMVGAYKR